MSGWIKFYTLHVSIIQNLIISNSWFKSSVFRGLIETKSIPATFKLKRNEF